MTIEGKSALIIEDEAISVLPVAPPVFAYWMQITGLEDR